MKKKKGMNQIVLVHNLVTPNSVGSEIQRVCLKAGRLPAFSVV